MLCSYHNQSNIGLGYYESMTSTMQFNYLSYIKGPFGNNIFSESLDTDYLTSTSYVYVLTLFFFPAAMHVFWETMATVHEQQPSFIDFSTLFYQLCGSCEQCTGPTNFTFQQLFSLKIGHMILFTHLKIILLKYFQFSFSAK